MAEDEYDKWSNNKPSLRPNSHAKTVLNEYMLHSLNWRTFEGKDWCSRDQWKHFLGTGFQLYEQENEENRTNV